MNKMKRTNIVFWGLILGVVSIFAQPDAILEKKIMQANEMYKQGQFSDAAKLYEEVSEKKVSATLYYNLGNSYYKANEIGRAILNYKRALRLDPSYADAKYNLQLAETKIIDNVNSTPTFFLKKWLENIIRSISSNQWVYIALSLFLLSIATFFIFAFSKIKKRRKTAFYTTLFSLMLMTSTLIFAGVNKSNFVKHNDAIILSGAVAVKSSPDEAGTEIFQLHEGVCVKVKNQLGEWNEIMLDNNTVGWVKDEVMERI